MDVIVSVIITIILTLSFIGCGVAWLKNENTYKNRGIILNAIYRYRIEKINHYSWDAMEVDFCDMESYDDTFARLWDWGYTRILPPEKFEIIEPYIL